MYTRRWKNNCCCPMKHHMENNHEDYETMCDNVMDNCYNYNDYDDCCECGYEDGNYCGDIFPASPMFAQSYVPTQRMDKTFRPCIGLQNGTIFPELVDPYYPCQSIDFINYIKKTNKIGEGCNG